MKQLKKLTAQEGKPKEQSVDNRINRIYKLILILIIINALGTFITNFSIKSTIKVQEKIVNQLIKNH